MVEFNELDWKNNLKVGDEVVLSGYSTKEITTVTHITKTQVHVKCGSTSIKFNKESGREIGGSTWNHRYIYQVTEEIRESLVLDKWHRIVYNKIDNIKRDSIHRLTVDECKDLFSILQKYNLIETITKN